MTTATSAPMNRERQAATILERSVCLTLECHYLGNNRKVDLTDLVNAAAPDRESGEEAVAVDAQQFHATKRLIDAKELNPVMRVFGVAKAKLRAKAIAAHRVFGERAYLIPLALVEETDADLLACQQELRKQARELAYRRYQPAIAKQRAALGSLFRDGDYFTPEQVVAAFAIDWNYVSFAAPEKLETVSAALARRAHRKHESRLAAAFDETVMMMRADALDVVTELEHRLTPGDDGKPRVLRGTALRDLEEYIAYLPKKNLTGDDRLVEVMARVAARADGLDVATLRDSDATREALRATAAAAKVELTALVETGRRAISLDGLLDT